MQCLTLILSLGIAFISSFLLWCIIRLSTEIITSFILKIMILIYRLHLLFGFLLSSSHFSLSFLLVFSLFATWSSSIIIIRFHVFLQVFFVDGLARSLFFWFRAFSVRRFSSVLQSLVPNFLIISRERYGGLGLQERHFLLAQVSALKPLLISLSLGLLLTSLSTRGVCFFFLSFPAGVLLSDWLLRLACNIEGSLGSSRTVSLLEHGGLVDGH